MIISTVFFLTRFKVIKPKFLKLNMNMCNLLFNYSWNIHGQIFFTKAMMRTVREETFANNIFAIYGLICKDLFRKTLFGLMNHRNKFCKDFFLSLIGSTAFKLSDLLTTFLFFRLFDNVLMKALYGRRGGKKSFKETKICGVIVSKWILFIWRFFLLSEKMNWVPSISFLHYKS